MDITAHEVFDIVRYILSIGVIILVVSLIRRILS